MANTLTTIQSELKAPKNMFNTFGNYRYRNAEGIMEAAKPLLVKYGASLTLTDDIVAIGNRIYVKATARFVDEEGHETSVSACAREDDAKKGMDGSQITGSSSSYARKYALNGLFLIDDTQDADTDAQNTEKNNRAAKEGKGKAKAADTKQTATAPASSTPATEAVAPAESPAPKMTLKQAQEFVATTGPMAGRTLADIEAGRATNIGYIYNHAGSPEEREACRQIILNNKDLIEYFEQHGVTVK